MAASLASQEYTDPLGAREKTTPETSKRGSDNLTPQNNAAKEARTEPATPGSNSKTPTLPAKKFFNRVKNIPLMTLKRSNAAYKPILNVSSTLLNEVPTQK